MSVASTTFGTTPRHLSARLGRYEFQNRAINSDKFWTIEPHPSLPNRYQVTYGRNGTAGTVHAKALDASDALNKIYEKESKGYTLKKPYAAPAPAPAKGSSAIPTKKAAKPATKKVATPAEEQRVSAAVAEALGQKPSRSAAQAKPAPRTFMDELADLDG
jgi:predicted DNA-binding WGR domain protein